MLEICQASPGISSSVGAMQAFRSAGTPAHVAARFVRAHEDAQSKQCPDTIQATMGTLADLGSRISSE